MNLKSDTDVPGLKGVAAFIFVYPEDGGSKFLENVGNNLPEYTS
jgi:hypothetical protein